MKKLPYSEGSVFLVPLRNSGYARGVVARSAPCGKVLLGYFFGPRLESIADVALNDLDPAKAVLQTRFGDLGLINGEWHVLGKIPGWNRADWPMPDFVRHSPWTKPRLVRYSDDDPNREKSDDPIEDDAGLKSDGLYGYGAVEIELSELLH